MSGLLSFHALAAVRGDGLHPKLRELLESRARLEADPAVVDIGAARGDAMVQAGPGPTSKTPAFRPGNVVGFEDRRAAAAVARKISVR